jgi:DNA (cytosine-5)-methyltransferase 1
MKKRLPLRAVDLFSGCGGLSRGLQDAGIPVLAAVDHWAPARTIYARNFKHAVLDIDLADVKGAAAILAHYRPTLVAGGPPCQDFSAAGTRREGARADLTRAYAAIVARLKPRWVVMENVPQVRASASYQAAREILKAAGYGLTERVLDASRCGVPQTRKRFFAIGRLDGEDGELDAAIDAALSPAPLGLRAYLGREAASWPEAYYRHPRTYERRAIYTLDEPSATIRGVNRPRPKTYGTAERPYHGQDAVKADHVQALTLEQRARIQTFPQDWDWCRDVLAKTDIEQAIGNAVPVALGAFVGRLILAADGP